MAEFKDKVREALNSPLSKDVMLISAYAVKKSKTVKDDEILENATEVSDVIAEKLEETYTLDPDFKEVRSAAIRILTEIAQETDPKWDDRLVKLLDVVF